MGGGDWKQWFYMRLLSHTGTQLKIVEIDTENGNVTLTRILFDGELEKKHIIVPYSEFLDTYSKGTRDAFEQAKYPAEGPLQNPKWHVFEFKSQIAIALGSLNRLIGDVDVMCRNKPSRGAVALQKYAVGKLILVPMSMNVKCEDKSDDDMNLVVRGAHLPSDKDMVLCAPPNTFPCPAWFVQPNEKKSVVNMCIKYRKVKVSSGGIDHDAETVTFDVPVLVNTVALKKGDELFKLRLTKEKTSKRAFVMVSGGSDVASGSKAPRVV